MYSSIIEHLKGFDSDKGPIKVGKTDRLKEGATTDATEILADGELKEIEQKKPAKASRHIRRQYIFIAVGRFGVRER